MRPLSILYLGRDSGTSRHRVFALRRLGHDVFLIDPATFLPSGSVAGAWIWHSGALFLSNYVRKRVRASLPGTKFDLVYVDSGELVGPELVRDLKRRFGTVINYNVDDPFGRRDGRRWRQYLAAVPEYDVVAVVRDENVDEAYAAGGKRVVRVHRSADEVAHAPLAMSAEDRLRWGTDVCFIGTWMPERGAFMAKLIEQGVPLSIYGDRWQKAGEWATLRSAWKGAGLYDDTYAKVIQCAKVNLGLLSKGNRDLVTQRSFEIPYLGGVFCAERTTEHTALYREDDEAVFWADADECAQKSMHLLRNEPFRNLIAVNGRKRCLENRTTNEEVLRDLLEKAMGGDQVATPKRPLSAGTEEWQRISQFQ